MGFLTIPAVCLLPPWFWKWAEQSCWWPWLSDAVLRGSCSSRRNIFGDTGTSLLLLSSLPARLPQNRLDKYPSPALQKIVLIYAWDHSRFSSDLLLCLNWFHQARRFSKCFFLPFDQCFIFNTPRSVSVSWSLWLSLTSGQPAVAAGQQYLTPCASLIRFLRCFSLFLCYHTGLWLSNLRAYQAAKVDFAVCCCPSLGGFCLCSV